LILSGLRARGKADRTLIVVPEALVFQWVHEMFRRFNLLFTVLDKNRIIDDQATHNTSAFAHNHLSIVAMEWLLTDSVYVDGITDHSWDLLIIDEAHHIRWDANEPSKKWLIANEISKACDGLLLLTATPRQYGYDTLFGLLHLVDPERFSDFDDFVDESEIAKEVATLAAKIQASGKVAKPVRDQLLKLFPEDTDLMEHLRNDDDPIEILRALVDRHGTGRVLFRNRRARIQGFPQRKIHLVGLKPSSAYVKRFAGAEADDWDELKLMDCATGRDTNRLELDKAKSDTRFNWIADFVSKLGSEKALIICANRERVVRLANFISQETGLNAAIFHENLSVIERDQQAAKFAESPECQVLVSSEIGGEGRNFQFAHKLVMADIPRHPDLVEQRIGRLDRIGQKNTIEIYVPYYQSTAEEALVRWYEEGFSAFSSSWNGTDVFLTEFVEDLMDVFRLILKGKMDAYHSAFHELVEKTRIFAVNHKLENEKSVDTLIDINSFDDEVGAAMLNAVEEADDDPSLEFFIRSIFDHYAVEYDDYDDRGCIVVHGDSLKFIENFPGIDSSGDTVITFSRDISLAREEMLFVTGDHPIADSALNLLLDRGEGIASMCKWESSPYDRGLIIESSWILEALGPTSLELGRFLPIQLKEVQMDHRGKFLDEKRHKKDPNRLTNLSWDEQQMTPKDMEKPLRDLLSAAEKSLNEWVNKYKESAIKQSSKELSAEIERMEYLHRVNKSVTLLDVEDVKEKNQRIMEAIKKASPRLDSIRIIFTQ